MDAEIRKIILKAQQSEMNEHHVYHHLAKRIKDKHNKKVILHIAKDEMRHYKFWENITETQLKPNHLVVYWYVFLSVVFGLSFALKLMEKGEDFSQKNYEKLLPHFPKVKDIQYDEHVHENEILSMLEEDRIAYASALVLGLNDALVELTGALAGLTLALQNSRLVALTGIIVGFAASLSMAASSYLSSKEDDQEVKSPFKSALYTGFAYIITVALLILPYFIFSSIYVSLAVMLSLALLIILAYTFYITTAKSLKFWRRFFEMAAISVTVAVVSFGVGYLLRMFFGVEV